MKKTNENLPAVEETEVAGKNKMTIYEYEQQYVKRQNVRGAKIFLRLFAAAIGIGLFALLFFISLEVYKLNEYAGYAAGVVCVLVYIFCYIVPLVKIMKLDAFVVNVNRHTARAAQQHNKKLRHSIADKIIDLTGKVEGVGWYDSQIVGHLAIAVRSGNEQALMKNLTALYTGSIKKAAKDIVYKSSLKSALYSAISQTNKIDAALVAAVNLQMIKDIVFLYGFRPSDARLVKIFARVLQNSLIAYGLGGMRIGNSVVQTMGNAAKGIPLLGSAISALVDSSVQGLTNGTLTAVIGFQTMKYLNTEYKLQEILDGIEVSESEEELKETCADLERELRRSKKTMPQAV